MLCLFGKESGVIHNMAIKTAVYVKSEDRRHKLGFKI